MNKRIRSTHNLTQEFQCTFEKNSIDKLYTLLCAHFSYNRSIAKLIVIFNWCILCNISMKYLLKEPSRTLTYFFFLEARVRHLRQSKKKLLSLFLGT